MVAVDNLNEAELAAPYPIGDDEVEAYRTQGWLRLPGLVPRDWALALDDRFDAISERLRQTGGGADDTYFTNERYHRQHRIYNDPAVADDRFRTVAQSERVVSVARRLIGTDQVLYLRSTIFEKPPAAEDSLPTTLHQDYPYFPFDRSGSVQIWISLGDIAPEAGPLRFVTGSHREYGVLGRTNVSEAEQERLARRYGSFPLTESLPMRAGDATVHHDLTVHGADANASDKARRGFTVTLLPPDVNYTGAHYWVTDDLGIEVNSPVRHERFPLL